MPGISWFYHGPSWLGAAPKKTPGISGISNIEPRAELRVGRAHVDAVGASLALAFLRAPPVGLGRLLGAKLARGVGRATHVPE